MRNFIHGCLLGCLLVCVNRVTSAAETANGLIGHWRFEGCDGKTVKDLSSRSNTGLIEAGELRPEKGATSLELDGLGAHVLIQETTPFQLANALTATLWFKASELRNNMVLFGVPHTNDGWTTPMFGMYFSDGRVVYGMAPDRGVKVLVETPTEVPTDTWTFLAATYDGAAVRLYLNGTLCGESPRTGKVMRNGQPLILGKGMGSAKPSFKGRLGEVRLYARSLGAEEVRALYDQTKSGFDLTGPVRRTSADGTVLVETHGNSPESLKPWRKNPTRLLELLAGYTPRSEGVKLDAYGGWLERPKEKATGFFYVKKIAGRQWLIDPDGSRFFHIAMNTTREPKEARANFGSPEQWAESVTTQLRTNGFNGLGNGSSTNLQKVKAPLVWVRRKDFMFAFAREKKLTEPAAGTQGFINRCMPVFHPEFEPFCEKFGRDLADTANDPTLLGIMTDNEVQCPVNLLDRFLALDPANPDFKPNREAATAWLAARKGHGNTNNISQRDRYEFIAFAFERYYRIVAKNIRHYDPNHLYLGSRINYHEGQFDNPWFWKALAPYHDVVSVNYYSYWGPVPSQFANWETWGGKPILITEWYAKAMDVPGLANTHGAGWLVRTQEDRARYYQQFALNAFEQKNIVGWHWFKYLDDPKESVALDAAGGANKGMFDLQGRPYLPLLNRARAIHREAYPLIEFFDTRNR
ncbi:MAG: LamG-like jellyroll fold domain-containing protein [Verrucomicrobiota bacterium]